MPVGQAVTVGNTKLTVIGVTAEKGIVGNTDFDAQLYTPIQLVFDKFLPSQFARFAGDSVPQFVGLGGRCLAHRGRYRHHEHPAG